MSLTDQIELLGLFSSVLQLSLPLRPSFTPGSSIEMTNINRERLRHGKFCRQSSQIVADFYAH